jgi:hypothetical protein
MAIPHQTLYIGVLVASAAISLVLRAFTPRDGSLAKPWPLEAKRNFLTERERLLCQRLVEALPNH